MLIRTIFIPGCRLGRFLWPFTNILSTTSVDLNAAKWSTSAIEHPEEFAKEPLGDDLSSIQTPCAPAGAGFEQPSNGWQNQFHPMLGPSVPYNDNVKPHTVSGQSFGNDPFTNVGSSTRKEKYPAGQGPTFALSSNAQGASKASTSSKPLCLPPNYYLGN
jgi:hypothetical protein